MNREAVPWIYTGCIMPNGLYAKQKDIIPLLLIISRMSPDSRYDPVSGLLKIFPVTFQTVGKEFFFTFYPQY